MLNCECRSPGECYLHSLIFIRKKTKLLNHNKSNLSLNKITTHRPTVQSNYKEFAMKMSVKKTKVICASSQKKNKDKDFDWWTSG